MIINIASNVDDPCAALNLSVTDSSFKCYMMDTGLLVSLAFRDKPYLENELYKAILLDKLGVNEGMIVENVVAQSLRSNGHQPFFYVEKRPDARKNIMEIDFLSRQQKKIISIEVKSGHSKSILSLQRLKEKFGKRTGM